MSKHIKTQLIKKSFASAGRRKDCFRILDANYNRAKEGLRVCEEVCRFIIDDRFLTKSFKEIRHGLTGVMSGISSPDGLLSSRASESDVGKKVYGRELSRSSVADIFYANIQRVKESVRVLEEFGKLKNSACALGFKEIRYKVYELEKKTARAVALLRDTR